jgi:hypothetical protein
VCALDGDVAESPEGLDLGAGRLDLDLGAGGQVDGDLDDAGRAEDLVLRRGLDPQHAGAVVGGGQLGHLHVAALRGVRGQDLDGGVGPVGGGEPDAPGGDVDDGGDRGGGVEVRHCALLRLVVSDAGNATLRSKLKQHPFHEKIASSQAEAATSLRLPRVQCNDALQWPEDER